MKHQFQIGDIIHVEIKRMGINGEGIGYHQRLAVFVDQALPGETVEATITEIYEQRVVAKINQIIIQSPFRVTPFCPYYQACGGCQTQHINDHQMAVEKKNMIELAFHRYYKKPFDSSWLFDTIPSMKTTHYRNKASLPIQKRHGKNTFGLYQPNSNIFVPIENCPIHHPKINEIASTIIHLLDHYRMDGYDPETKKGYVRGLVIRVAEGTLEIQVSLVMLKKSDRMKSLVKDLVSQYPEIVSVFEVMHPDMKKLGYFTETMTLLYGKEMMRDRLGDYHFYLRPDAFFQLNSSQAHPLYETMRELALLKKHEVAIDAYSGIAPIAHYISKDLRQVYAIEADHASCESAKKSLKENGISNVIVLESDFKRALSGMRKKRIDVMFFDPPRTGLGKETIDLILEMKPKRLVYTSCNPSTLAKDVDDLSVLYSIQRIVPFDMFPQTSHVESITLLSLKTA